METAAGELSDFGLLLMENSAFEPTGTNHAIGLAASSHQIMKCVRRSCTIGVDVSDQVRKRRELQPFDQRSAFANSLGKVEKADERIIGGNFLDDATGVVFATVEHDDKLKSSVIFLLEVTSILTQNRLDPILLVIGRDQEQEAGLAHLMLNSL